MAEDWQKVRVTFQDADGNEVSAVMWRHGGDEATVFSPDRAYGPSVWIEWSSDFEQVSVTPIRELPTGVGAVIRCIGDFETDDPRIDVYVRTAYGRWTNSISSWKPTDIEVAAWEYEVLSEGIQIGDVK